MISIKDDWQITIKPPYEVEIRDNKGVLHYHYLNIKPIDTLDLQVIAHNLILNHK